MVTWGSSGGRGGATSSLVGGNGGSSDAGGSGTWLVAGAVTSSFTGSAASFATIGPFLCPGKCTFVLCCKLSRCCRYQYCCCSYKRNHFFFFLRILVDNPIYLQFGFDRATSVSVFTYLYIIKGKAELKKANKQDLSIFPPNVYN